MPLRFDRAELPTPERTAEGYLRTTAIVARPGVLVYPQPNGKQRRELVTPEVLAASAKSLGDVAVTLRHPTDSRGAPIKVTSANVKDLSVGHSREAIEIDAEGCIRVPLTVMRADAVTAIDAGMRGVSPLYDCDLDETPGVHPTYGAYDAIQTARRNNSIAVCPLGRGGPVCHLRADDSEAVIEIEGGAEAAPAPEPHADELLDAEKLKAIGEAKPADPNVVDVLAAILKLLGVATVEEAHAKLSTDWCELMAKRDALHAMLGLLSVENSDAGMAKIKAIVVVPEVRADSVEARAWFHRRAKLHAAAIAAKIPNPDALDDNALRKAVVLARQPSLRADESEAYYAAAFDLAPVDHLAALRLPSQPAPQVRADESPAKPSTNRWNDVFNAVPARS